MAKMGLVTVVTLIILLPAFYAMSLENDFPAENVSVTVAPSAGQEVRKIRQIEAELELLRRAVTESKAGSQCGTQSPQPNALKEVTQEIQTLRSQFHALQLQRELSVLRSDILLAQSAMLAEPGGRQAPMVPETRDRMLSALLAEDGSRAASAPAGKTTDSAMEYEGGGARQSNLQPIPGAGAVYERWGNEACPNDTELVYSGVIGGSSHDQAGAAANALCLPLNPVLENHPGVANSAPIFGAEFEMNPLPGHDLDPRCAVCRIPRATVLMVPATNACHPGWTLEYSGYIMAGHHTHPAATEFVCIDSERHTRIGADKNDNGKLFYYVTASCGSLPCPPYQNGKVLPCVVCSK